jgi:hypothetical protein
MYGNVAPTWFERAHCSFFHNIFIIIISSIESPDYRPWPLIQESSRLQATSERGSKNPPHKTKQGVTMMTRSHPRRRWQWRPLLLLWLLIIIGRSTTTARNMDHHHDDDDEKRNDDDTTPAAAAPDGNDDDNGIVFDHFVAHDATMTCTADEHARPFNKQIRGVNLGGYLVLEPWITPSLFYQFLGAGENETAFDMYTFCQVLGPVEANQQLRRHWEHWVTEDILDELYQMGNGINSLRLPIGDFQFIPYGPYMDGCIDGSLDYIERILDWSLERGLSVLLDIHTMKDSQNGFDNSVRFSCYVCVGGFVCNE